MKLYIYTLRNENIISRPGNSSCFRSSFSPLCKCLFLGCFSLVRKRGVYYYFMLLTVLSWQCLCTCFVFRCVLHKFFIVRALFTTIFFFVFLEPRVFIVSICAFHLVGNFSFSTSIKSITRPFKSRKQQKKFTPGHCFPLTSCDHE